MADLWDPEILPFLEQLLEDSDQAVAHAASHAVGVLVEISAERIWGVFLTSDVDFMAFQSPWDALMMLKEEELPPLRALLLYAFRDQCLEETDGPFPGHSCLTEFKGALLKSDWVQYFVYEKDGDRLIARNERQHPLASAPDVGPVEPGASCAVGHVSWAGWRKYLLIHVMVNADGLSYLFRREGPRGYLLPPGTRMSDRLRLHLEGHGEGRCSGR